MHRTILLVACCTLFALAGCEEPIDEFNELLPLALGAMWEYDSDSDDSEWLIEVAEGAGVDGTSSFDFSLKADGAAQYRHDLYQGEVDDDSGWVEVEPVSGEVPDLYLLLPAEDGASWSHDQWSPNESHSVMSYDGREDVSVPAGDFEQAWVLLREKESDYSGMIKTSLITDWYVPAVGLVKRAIINTEGEETVLTLVDYELPVVE